MTPEHTYSQNAFYAPNMQSAQSAFSWVLFRDLEITVAVVSTGQWWRRRQRAGLLFILSSGFWNFHFQNGLPHGNSEGLCRLGYFRWSEAR